MFTLIRQTKQRCVLVCDVMIAAADWVSFRHLTHFLVLSCLSKNFVAVGLFPPSKKLFDNRLLFDVVVYVDTFVSSMIFCRSFICRSFPFNPHRRDALSVEQFGFVEVFSTFPPQSFSQNTDLKKEKEISFRTVEKATYSLFN